MSVKLTPDWIVGFTDGEGCFCVSVNQNAQMRFGFSIQTEFTIVQHKVNIQLLYGLKHYFKCGTVGVNDGDRYHWRVCNRNHFQEILIPFFEHHPLKGKRYVEFNRFRDICRMLANKEHMSEEEFLLVMQKAKNLRVRFKE